MDFHGPDFVLAIIGMSTVGWVLTTWIRARHGYPGLRQGAGRQGRGKPHARGEPGTGACQQVSAVQRHRQPRAYG